MGLFDTHIMEITAYISRQRNQGKVSEFIYEGPVNWPPSRKSNLVLEVDTAVELGDPRQASVSFLVWDDKENMDPGEKITVIGPDLCQIRDKKASFGKIVIVKGANFNEDNSYERYMLLDRARYALKLDGYMMRSVSQYQREWSRVSRKSLQDGFSFQILGTALIDELQKIDFVESVKVIFVTSGKEDVLELKPISEAVAQRISAMKKITDAMHVEDCGECEYNDVCSDVAELRAMIKRNREKKEHHA